MGNPIIYPLKELLAVKHKRVETAEKVVQEKKVLLEKEEEKLRAAEKERDKVKKHYQEKLQQLRDTVDQVSTSPKIQQMKVYIKIVDENLKTEESKCNAQKEQVKLAENILKEAIEILQLKRKDEQKFLEHQKEWVKEQRKELEIIEGREQDELGSLIYLSQHHKHK